MPRDQIEPFDHADDPRKSDRERRLNPDRANVRLSREEADLIALAARTMRSEGTEPPETFPALVRLLTLERAREITGFEEGEDGVPQRRNPKARRSATVDVEMLSRVQRAINKVGGHTNQIAHWANIHERPADVAAVELWAHPLRMATALIAMAIGAIEAEDPALEWLNNTLGEDDQ